MRAHQLYERHAPAVYRYLARRAGPGVAEDLLGDVFVIALSPRTRTITLDRGRLRLHAPAPQRRRGMRYAIVAGLAAAAVAVPVIAFDGARPVDAAVWHVPDAGPGERRSLTVDGNTRPTGGR